MCEDVLQSIRKLERVNVTETVLDVGIDNELGEAKDFTTKVEGISKPRLLPLLRRQRLDGFQVHVVVEMQVVQVLPNQNQDLAKQNDSATHLPVDKEVEHVVTLSAHLQTCFHPIKTRRLEKLRRLELAE